MLMDTFTFVKMKIMIIVTKINLQSQNWINSQSLEDTQVGYILQKYTLDKYTLERAFNLSYTISSILTFIHIFEYFKLSYTFLSI